MRYGLILLLVLTFSTETMADSLFRQNGTGRSTNLISNKRPKFEVGDIVTVVVQEVTDASTESNTNTKKESNLNAQAPVATNTYANNIAEKNPQLDFLNSSNLPNWDIKATNEHKGRGLTKRTNKLTSTVSCLVTKDNGNGTIEIEGTKKVAVNREFSILNVKGTARTRDITPENIVQSSQLANATIELKGKGPLWNNQRRGLIMRFLDFFSPF